MTSLLTINHYVNQSNNFVNDVKDQSGAYYVYVARPNPWTNANGDIDDTQYQLVNNSITQIELDTFNELLYGKRVGALDVTQSVRRVDWVANTVYPEYDANDPDLYDRNFYVVTTGSGDEYNVYKCIYNNEAAPSTVKPSMKQALGTFITGDGYVWKYMYTVEAGANSKFTTANYIPVTANAAVQGNAVPGTIDAIKIVDGGVGYLYDTGTLQSVVDRTTLKIAANSSTSNDYYTGSSIYLKSGFGAGQVRLITDYDGSSKNVVVQDPLDLFVKLDLNGTSNVISGGASVGQIASQTYDNITYTFRSGYFNSGANVVQSDTGVSGRLLSANSTNLVVSRFDKNATFSNLYPVRDVADTGTITTNKVNISTTGALSNNVKVIVFGGSGYAANANVTIVANGTGSGAAANAFANSTGRIQTIFVTANGSGYVYEPIVAVSPPVAQTFNANAIVSNAIAISTASRFAANDLVTYARINGGANIGISNGSYYVSFSNSTHISLAATAGGANIALVNTATSDTNHSIQGSAAVVRLLPDTLYVSNAAAGAVFASEYAVNNFIRVGENANTNIRRITSVNSTVIAVNLPFTTSISSANAYKMNTAAEPVGDISVSTANAVISNTNLTSIRLTFANSSPPGESFIIGERVDYVGTSNVSLGANGVVAYTNSSVVFISSVLGTWNPNNKIRGISSQVLADVVSVDSNPNIILKNPSNNFVIGYPVDFNSLDSTPQGSSVVVDFSSLTGGIVEYEIGPTVNISGDGLGAVAVARVDVSNNSGNSINQILVVNTGYNYTQANIVITSNSSYGSNASAYPIVSPLLGHGSDPAAELGARYAAIDVKFENAQTEEWTFPSSIQFRKVGVIKDPAYANVVVTLKDFTRTELGLSNTSAAWSNGEVILQVLASSNATGKVMSGNSTVLKLMDVKGTFATTNTIVGLTSGTTANVTAAGVITFSSNGDLVQEGTGATAKIVTVEGNDTLYLTNVIGQMVSNAVVSAGEASATINTIAISSGDATSNFGQRFNQTSRVTLSSNVGAFVLYDFAQQGDARGMVIKTSDIDVEVANGIGFSSSDDILNSNTSAVAKAIFANSTYLKLTGVTNTAAWAAGQTINNGSVSTTISSVHSALVLSDVTRGYNFQANSSQLVSSTANGVVSSVIAPDIIRESGKVIYTEASNTVIDRTLNSTEEVRLIIKF